MIAELNPSHANPTAVTAAAITAALLIFTVNAFISLGAWQDGSWGMMFLIFVASPVANAVLALAGLAITPIVKRAAAAAPLWPYVVTVTGLPVCGAVYQFLSVSFIPVRGGC
jgi:hypothetical protein